MKAENYYYKVDSRGARKYYERYTDKVVARRDINPEVIDLISKFSDEDAKIRNYIKLKEQFHKKKESFEKKQKELRQMKEDLDDLNREMRNLETPSYYEYMRKKESYDNPERERKDQENREREESFRKAEREEEHREKYEEGTKMRAPSSVEITFARSILAEYKIFTVRDWRAWMRSNHVDKGGNLDICKKIMQAWQTVNY